ncbi:MAG: hypothetical protein ACTSXA_13150 [Candidatus Heimdallarchaeota archaeon]
MSQTDKLFHICHVMFSYGITKPEMARSIEELSEILQWSEEVDLLDIVNELENQGYVGILGEKYFLLGKGIVAVAAIFT